MDVNTADGSTLVMSLSGPLAARCPRRLARSLAELRRRGLRAEADESTAWDVGDRAGAAGERAQRFTNAVQDPGVCLILSSVGGFGARELLPLLDPAELASVPTAVVGYSDTSTLLLWLHEVLGWVTYYGPAALPQFGEYGGCSDYTWNSLAAALSGTPDKARELPAAGEVVVETLLWDSGDDRPRTALPAEPRQTLVPGVGTGSLIAANISTLAEDLRQGLFHDLDWRGRVVFLEDSDGGSLAQCRADVRRIAESGAVDGAAALVFGRFAQQHRSQWSDSEVACTLSPLMDQCGGPVITEAEFGHTDPVLTLPLGARTRVDARDPDRSPTLTLLPGRQEHADRQEIGRT